MELPIETFKTGKNRPRNEDAPGGRVSSNERCNNDWRLGR